MNTYNLILNTPKHTLTCLQVGAGLGARPWMYVAAGTSTNSICIDQKNTIKL